MSRAVFADLVETLTPLLEKQTTNFKRPVPVDKRIAIALYFLAHGMGYGRVADYFGVGKTTVSNIVQEFCYAMEMAYMGTIKWPSDKAGWQAVASGFYAKRGMPGCIGAIDCTHIEAVAPINTKNKADYYDLIHASATTSTTSRTAGTLCMAQIAGAVGHAQCRNSCSGCVGWHAARCGLFKESLPRQPHQHRLAMQHAMQRVAVARQPRN